MLQGGYTALFEAYNYGVEVLSPPEHGLVSQASAQKVRAPSFFCSKSNLLGYRDAALSRTLGCSLSNQD
jgi:hypothetical protein